MKALHLSPKACVSKATVVRFARRLDFSGYPEIRKIDLNPVIVHETGASIVDARIICEQRKKP